MALKRAQLAKLITKAFKATGDIRVSAVFNRIEVGDYDPNTGKATETPQAYPVQDAIITNISSNEAGWFPADRNTEKLIINAADLTIKPTTTDILYIDGEAEPWEIVKVKPSTGNLLWFVYVIRP